MSWQPPGQQPTGWQPDGWQPDGTGSNPPSFIGTISDISETENTGTHQYDLGAYFTGADSYAIDPAVETGWSFDTGTGVLEIDTDALGTFGPFTVTATNANGDTDSNAFSVTVAAAVESTQPTGGWLFLNMYAAEQQRRKAAQRRRKELEEETEQIEDAVAREIAQLLRVQEAKDEKRKELERLTELARSNADLEAARQYSERVAQAFEKALKTGSRRAAIELEKELQKAAEEEQFLLTAMMLFLEDD